MTFDSKEFLIFFGLIYVAWFAIRHLNQPVRNGFLLIASYFFYGFWSPPFVILLLVSTFVDFYLAKAIEKSNDARRRKQLVGLSVVINLSILGFFKYFNFFIDSALMILPADAFLAPTLKVILPVGISFYTFQSMSYSIDVYRKRLPAANSLIDFALYVAFFPQLVAGPIERAARMLPQFAKGPKIEIDKTIEGLELCIRGFFKKIVIADNIAPFVNLVFGDVESANSLALWMACYGFAIQIYADFSGYSDIARGTAKMLGFELMVNFNAPYRSINVAEFWRRWHISLSSWFRDYLFVPLAGRQAGKIIRLRSLFLVMALCGLWHGAAWNFVLWGLFQGVTLVIHSVSSARLNVLTASFNRPAMWLVKFGCWFITFHSFIVSFVLFRAESVADIGVAYSKMFLDPVSDFLAKGFTFIPNAGPGEQIFYMVLIGAALVAQFSNLETKYKLSSNAIVSGVRGAVSLVLIFFLYPTVKEQFIYFQF